MKAPCSINRLLIAALFCGVPVSLFAQETQSRSPVSSNAPAPQSDSRQGRAVGAPQVLEISPQDVAPSAAAAPQPGELPPANERALGMGGDPRDDGLRPAATMSGITKRNYLGVLYATSEDGGEPGVKVLDVVEGSPAAQSGFQGVNAPGMHSNDLVKAAIVVLAMSPVGMFAIPLAIAHDIYTNRRSPGDLIVAVNNHPVRDALEFSEEMRNYQPGDTVSFSVVRGGKQMQLSVVLAEEPS